MLKKRIVTLLTIVISSIICGNIIASAYAIKYRDGFYPTPAYISCHSSFSQDTLNAFHNACVTWNSAGCGNLVYRNTSTHSVTQFPYQNNLNQITKGYRGSNQYLMSTAYVQTTGVKVLEADIDINVSFPFGTASGCYHTRSVATHEIGHLLGLDDITASGNVMCGTIAMNEQQYVLSNDDINGLNAIYGG